MNEFLERLRLPTPKKFMMVFYGVLLACGGIDTVIMGILHTQGDSLPVGVVDLLKSVLAIVTVMGLLGTILSRLPVEWTKVEDLDKCKHTIVPDTEVRRRIYKNVK